MIMVKNDKKLGLGIGRGARQAHRVGGRAGSVGEGGAQPGLDAGDV